MNYRENDHYIDPEDDEMYDDIVRKAEAVILRCRKNHMVSDRQKKQLLDIYEYLRDFGGYAYKIRWKIEDLLDDFDVSLKESYKHRSRLIKESATEWFDEHGNLLKEIPEECVEELSSPGQQDTAAERWVEELGFEVPRDKAIEYIDYYGAWDKDELEDKTDKELAMIILWLLACDINDNGFSEGIVH